MTEFDFDELDRSITEAMSKSGLLKNDSQAVGMPAQPAAAPSSNPSNPVSSSVEPGKLAPGPGPVANMGASPTTPTTVSSQSTPAVPPANTAASVQSSTSVSVSTPASNLKPSVEAAAVQSQTLPANTASISVGMPSVSSTASSVQAAAMNNSSASVSLPTSSSLPQNAVPQAVNGETIPIKSGLPKTVKAKRRGRFMDIVSSQPGVSKHPGKVKRSTVLASSLNSASSNISNVSSEPQSSGSRAFVRGSSVLPQNQQSNPEFADDNDSDEAGDSKNEKRSYSIGGTHGRDIAPSAELVESLQKDAQDASNEIGFSQAESRANDIQSIEDASAEDDEDDARIQDPPTPKKHRFMPIGGKPKPVEKAPNPPVVKASVADVERASGQSEQPLQPAEPQIESTESLPVQPAAAEPDPPHEQTIDEIESGAIYDTSEYYTEFKDDKKHKQSRHSGLKWFLVIIVFLALGALAGAGYFFLTRY